jgi:oligopeptide/dipeptide ABC transporter ATP-binding protein
VLAPSQTNATRGSHSSPSADRDSERARDPADNVETALAEVSNLAVAFPEGPERWRRVVDGASLRVDGPEAVGLVGESGSGKTLSALSLVRLVPEPGRIVAGSVRLDGIDVRAAAETTLDRLRGGVVGLVFQEPSLALNPVRSVATQVAEAGRLHLGEGAAATGARVERLLAEVGLDAASVGRAFPHQLSGGQRQRVLIAAALSGEPRLLVADEPTAALDAVARRELLELLGRLRRDRGLGLLLVSHDLGTVARATDRITVLYAGETVESGPTAAVLQEPLHPYTGGLIAARPDGGAASGPWPTIPGRPPRPAEWGGGCRFVSRCPRAMARCAGSRPALVGLSPGRAVRCFLHADDEASDG